jgi:hypothetical protein
LSWIKTPCATASAVNVSFSEAEPSHQKIWSGWHNLAISSTHRMMLALAVFGFDNFISQLVLAHPARRNAKLKLKKPPA